MNQIRTPKNIYYSFLHSPTHTAYTTTAEHAELLIILANKDSLQNTVFVNFEIFKPLIMSIISRLVFVF